MPGKAPGLQQTAKSQISANGEIATVAHIVPGSRDPSNPSKWLPSSTQTYTGKAFLSGYAEQEIDGSSILANDSKVLMAFTEFNYVPIPGDTVTIAGTVFQVVYVRKVRLEAQNILLILQVRN